MKSISRSLAAAAGLLLLAACDSSRNPVIITPGDPDEPRDLAVRYEWVFESFNGVTPVGYPAVDVTWLPPSDWNGEVFRVYGRRSGTSSYSLIATVTSCTEEGCVYRDRNVRHGVDYEYYVATVEESSGAESSSEFAEAVRVPTFARPVAPVAHLPVGLDDAVYLRWADDSNGAGVARYLVFLTELDGEAQLYRVGETDGLGFLDEQAENGSEYGYRIAAVDTLGHVSALSQQAFGVPRPDFGGELVYAFSDSAAVSGFRFVGSESENPIVAGTSTSAHFRLERTDAAGWRIVPLNGAQVTEFPNRTTALECGPGADAECRAATVAPAAGYTNQPLAVKPEFSYVFRVPGSGGAFNYGVIRATLLGSDQNGRDLMIFDWAYQLIANEPRLNVVRR